MPVELTETLWLDARQQLSLGQLAQLSALTEAELRELVEFGVLTPSDPAASTYSAEYVIILRTACRLRREFDLDLHAMAVSLRLLDRIHELEAQLHSARAQLPRRVR
jgi:chaperone modulatory protein CbpM